MIFRFLLLTACLLTSACSSTTFFLNNRYLEPDESIKNVQDLTNLGYNVEQKMHRFPNNILVNTIIYFPNSQSDNNIMELQSYLSSQGYHISNVAVSTVGNHQYTKTNIGIYIFPSNGIYSEKEVTNIFIPSIIDEEFFGKDCKGKPVLDILADGSFILDSLSQPELFLTYKGTWKLKSESLLALSNQNKNYTFSITKKSSKSCNQSNI